MFDEHKEIYLFFTDLRPNSITMMQRAFSPSSTLQATWIQHVSQVATVAVISGQPSRLTNSFVEYKRFDSLMSHFIYFKIKDKTTNILHNLYYVLLFVVSFTDSIFDAFNCWNHCIFKVLCVRHRYIFPCTAANRCI